MSKSTDLNAKEAIDAIEAITSEEALSTFIDGDERKTVNAAAAAKYAELSQPAAEDTTNEDAPEEPVSEDPPSEDPPPAEEPSEEDEAPQATETTDVESFDCVCEALDARLEDEIGVEPSFAEAVAEFKASAKKEGSNVRLSSLAIEKLKLGVAGQVAADSYRRGLSQPSKAESGLIELYKSITEAE